MKIKLKISKKERPLTRSNIKKILKKNKKNKKYSADKAATDLLILVAKDKTIRKRLKKLKRWHLI